ncbi:hypothetical protein BDZ94DRAFT_1051622 [Collybia nuda]|uniref:AAA+ ATPase domain-containing protein n=1 Tax=Collybia nuda TaxID=64659 RepID=A0A9P5Y0S9_9AGAR|nr:hypothetical protein BDZ94DRAFT_1051622 [Collybia nuda]
MSSNSSTHPGATFGKLEGTESLSTIEELGKGIINTRRADFTILIVGETGTGKTTFLSLLANILKGNSPRTYATFNKAANEAGGSEKHSQTNETLLYSFESKNGVKLRIIDTPGLADTRGIEQDERHKANIVNTIKSSTVAVDAVLILANGTAPRLGAATDYALSTLTSILPVTLAKNIGFLFTNTSSPLNWNFDEDSLPEFFSNSPSFFLNNPVAMQAKYLEEKKRAEENKKVNQRRLNTFKSLVEEGHRKASGEVAKILSWLDTLLPRPIIDIVLFHNQLQTIEMRVSDILMTMQEMETVRHKLRDVEKIVEDLDSIIKQPENCQSAITHRVYRQVETANHNTLCTQPGCYSNCDEDCTLSFSFDSRDLLACWIFSGSNTPRSVPKCHPLNNWLFSTNVRGSLACVKCGHSNADHRHYNSRWELCEDTEYIIDPAAKSKYDNAIFQKDQLEYSLEELRHFNKEMEKLLAGDMLDTKQLLENYNKLSLSGSFAYPVQKSISLLELNLETMRGNGTEAQNIKSVEKALCRMQEKFAVVEKAQRQSVRTEFQGEVC